MLTFEICRYVNLDIVFLVMLRMPPPSSHRRRPSRAWAARTRSRRAARRGCGRPRTWSRAPAPRWCRRHPMQNIGSKLRFQTIAVDSKSSPRCKIHRVRPSARAARLLLDPPPSPRRHGRVTRRHAQVHDAVSTPGDVIKQVPPRPRTGYRSTRPFPLWVKV